MRQWLLRLLAAITPKTCTYCGARVPAMTLNLHGHCEWCRDERILDRQ